MLQLHGSLKSSADIKGCWSVKFYKLCWQIKNHSVKKDNAGYCKTVKNENI